jgi:hypothetical protein
MLPLTPVQDLYPLSNPDDAILKLNTLHFQQAINHDSKLGLR